MTDNLTLTGSYAYLNTRVDELVVEIPDSAVVSILSSSFNTSTAAGEPLAYAPENKLVLTANYRLPLAADVGDVALAATYVYTDEMQSCARQVSPYCVLPDYQLLNLNLSWDRILGGPLDLALFATNVTDEEYITFITGNWSLTGFELSRTGQPRMLGARLRYHFRQ